MKRLLFLSLMIIVSITACEKEKSAEEILEDNINAINAYLADNGLTAQRLVSDNHIVIHEEGGSNKPNVFNTVLVSYEGYLLTGEKFDSSLDNNGGPIEFELGNVIPGWQEGITLLGVGGRATLLIPSKLAYGGTPPANSIIPEHAPLRFEVELHDFN